MKPTAAAEISMAPDAGVRSTPRAVWRVLRWGLRVFLVGLIRLVYRLQVDGRERLPARGGALVVCNHLSLIDGLLVIAAARREIRFLMYQGAYERPWIKPVARLLGVIPISSEQRPRDLIHSLREASEAIRKGEIVGIFAEGQVTRIGQMLPFRRGFQRIMKDVQAPIIPVCLDGVWGSIFSFAEGRFFWKWPRRIPYPVAVRFGEPLPPSATPAEVRQQVQQLGADAWPLRKAWMRPLHHGFVRTARRHPRRFAMADARVSHLRFGSALIRTIFLARRLRAVWQGERHAAILLPPSVAGALVNLAALMLGKATVNLNYTLSAETLASCLRQCDVKTVVTSRAFLERLKFTVPAETVFLEDVAAKPRLGEKLWALLLTWLAPVRWLEKAVGCDHPVGLDDLATIMFSSGSTGEPKGVMLTHYQVGSNAEQVSQVFSLGREDRFLGILPFFHSFGFTATLILPAVLGAGVVYHPNPLEAKPVGELVRRYAITYLLATPAFLQLYLRTCEPEDFGSLRLVMAGAEKLPDKLADAFEEKFGIRPLEGYGCTECAPVVSVNTHDFRAAGFRQVGGKRGKIGHPLPGLSVRIVDPETRQPLPAGQPGLLLVRGPNVMQGYLGRPDKTAEVLDHGWYVTGDIASLDDDGFLQITDRLSRFSKIGGEMVPHLKVEEKLHELAAAVESIFVVAGVPDEKKGEHLVVLHTLPADELQVLLKKLSQLDLPNLWIPRPQHFIRVESLPRLGTGKLDLRKVRDIALSSVAGG